MRRSVYSTRSRLNSIQFDPAWTSVRLRLLSIWWNAQNVATPMRFAQSQRFEHFARPTFGIQGWLQVHGGRVPFKTAPSGGARHPVEPYVVVRRVSGIKPGLYHYASDRHEL